MMNGKVPILTDTLTCRLFRPYPNSASIHNPAGALR